MKRFSRFKHLFTLCFLLFFAANSCKKGEATAVDPVKSQTQSPNCYYEQYEDQGSMFYEHLKYNMATVDPLGFVPTSAGALLQQVTDSLYQMVDGWTVPQMLTHFENEGLISSDISQNLTTLNGIIDDYSSYTSDLDATVTAIDNLTDSYMNSLTVTCGDKNKIMANNSIVKNMLVYLDEVGIPAPLNINGGVIEDRGCTWNFTCISMLTLSIVGLAASTWVAAYHPLIGFSLITTYAILFDAVLNDLCCPDELDCREPIGVSLAFSSCTPSAAYTAYGFGDDDTSLAWTNIGGTPATATTPTSAPTLTITQSVSSSPVSTNITSTCSDGTTSPPTVPFVRNLDNLFKQVLGVTLTGDTNVDPPSGYNYYYSALNVLSNPFYTHQWSISSNGTITNTYNNGITVQWDTGMTDGHVTLTVVNNCSGGETEVHKLNVSNKDPDIP